MTCFVEKGSSRWGIFLARTLSLYFGHLWLLNLPEISMIAFFLKLITFKTTKLPHCIYQNRIY
jgi:hypothetical protein